MGRLEPTKTAGSGSVATSETGVQRGTLNVQTVTGVDDRTQDDPGTKAASARDTGCESVNTWTRPGVGPIA